MVSTKHYRCTVVGRGVGGTSDADLKKGIISPRRFDVQALDLPPGTQLDPSSPRLPDGTQLKTGDEYVVRVTTHEVGHELIQQLGWELVGEGPA